MSGLRAPTALFLLLTLLPAAILAFLGWRGMAPLVEELTKAARADVARAFDAAAADVTARLQARDDDLARRLRAAAADARRELPFAPPGQVLARLEQAVGGALEVRGRDGVSLVPRGPQALALDHLPEWPAFAAFRAACDRGADAAAPAFAAPALQALAVALRRPRDPDAVAAALQPFDGDTLAAAGPLPVEALVASAAGRARLRDGVAAGWLDAVPATAAARLAWYEAAGVDGERLAAQRRRAAGEREGDGASLRAEVAPGVELVLLRDVAHELAALAPARRGDCAIALAPASAPSALRFDGDGAASGAIASALGPLAIAVVHEGLPRIQAEARRQRWLTGVGVALLLLVMATGTLLLRATLLRERRLRQLRLQFIANVSHELRTPLTGLRLHAELLARDDVDAAARRRYGEVADGEGARLSALVEDLLDFAALEQGRRRLEPEPVDLAAAAAALVGGWQTRADQDGVQLGCEALGEAAALVDPTALARILTNLLQNAFRHGRPPRAGGQSRIAVRVGPGPLLVVADNGPGVRGLPRDGLFERFVKQDGSQGVGLGLALSRELAEACGGALQHRDTGDETRFELSLPAAPALPPADEVTP